MPLGDAIPLSFAARAQIGKLGWVVATIDGEIRRPGMDDHSGSDDPAPERRGRWTVAVLRREP